MSRRSNAANALLVQGTNALKELGANIKTARVRRRITQKDLAGRMTVSLVTVARLEKGDPSVGLSVLLKALEVMDLVDDIALVANPDNDIQGKPLVEARPKRVRPKKRLKDLDS